MAREAFKTTPLLFSDYIWHSAIGSGITLKRNYKVIIVTSRYLIEVLEVNVKLAYFYFVDPFH
jgi:hypothetical protein